MSCENFASAFMSDDEMMKWIARRLGAPRQGVELHPCNLADAINDAKLWFLSHKGVEKYEKQTLTAGQQRYPYPQDAQSIIDVYPPDNRAPSPGFLDPYGYGYGNGYPYSTYGTLTSWGYKPGAQHSAGGPVSAAADGMAMGEMTGRLLSKDWDWWADHAARAIIITPEPTCQGEFCVRYFSNCYSFDAMEPKDYFLLREYALALAKETLGEIRRKYASLPGPNGGTIELNGDALVQEAREDKERLDREMRLANPTIYMVAG